MVRKILILSEFARYLLESSEDSESSDDEENTLLLMMFKPNIISHTRCQNYVENVVPLYTDEEFKMHFRMKRTTFQFLLELLRTHLCKQSERFGRQPISPEKQLLIILQYGHWLHQIPIDVLQTGLM